MKYFSFAAALLASVALSSCASHSYKELSSYKFKQPKKTLEIDFFKQATNECGPVSLFTITHFFKSKATLNEIKAMTYTPISNGSHKSDMLAAARRLDFAPYKLETLPQALTALVHGSPVLVFQNLGLSFRPNWHYSVLTGYDAGLQEVSLHDGKDAYAKMTFKRFANSWERGDKWAYIITPAAKIPIEASFEQVMINAQVFTDIKNRTSALALLTSAKKKWPRRYEINTALSNLYFEIKDLDKAQRHAMNAVELKPEMAGLYYNLAYIQISNKQKKEALISKESALKLTRDISEKQLLIRKFKEIGL